MLFERLPQFPPALPDEELRELATLPEWPTTQEVLGEAERSLVMRLFRRGLVKVTHEGCEMYAGKTSSASVRRAIG
jgi:hypothetical protein